MSEPEYRVVSQVRSSQLDDSGRRADNGWSITFRDSMTGVSGDLFISDTYYTAENVRTLILAKLETIRAVHALTG